MRFLAALEHFTVIRGDHNITVFKNTSIFHGIQKPAKFPIQRSQILIVIATLRFDHQIRQAIPQSMHRFFDRRPAIKELAVELIAGSIGRVWWKEMYISEKR